MTHEHDPIVCASEKAALTDALEKAVGVGNRWKVEAELLEVRVRELEANRDLFQGRRDEALREAERKTVMMNKVLEATPVHVEVEKHRPEQGDLVIVRASSPASDEALETWSKAMTWIRSRFPGVTFIVAAPGAEFALERMRETDLRKVGLIAAARVDAGTQQLEAAFGTHTKALEKCKSFLEWAKNWVPAGRECGELHAFLPKLDEILTAELAKPTPPAPPEAKGQEGGSPT